MRNNRGRIIFSRPTGGKRRHDRGDICGRASCQTRQEVRTPPRAWPPERRGLKASGLKLALNQLIASLTAAFAFSLGMVRRDGLDIGQFMQILRSSSLYAPTFEQKLPRYFRRDFSAPNFPTRLLLKDVLLILDEGKAAGLETAALEGIREVVEKAISQGLGEADYSSIYEVIDPGPEV